MIPRRWNRTFVPMEPDPPDREYVHDFAFAKAPGVKGITFAPIFACYVFPQEHDSMEDIILTISHESVHACLKTEDTGLSEEREEKLVVYTLMAQEGILV